MDENEIELSEDKIAILKKAYRRPVSGVILDAIATFERVVTAPVEEPEEEVITAENLFTQPRTYGEYLRYFKAQEASVKAEDEEPVEEQIPIAEEEEVEEEPLIPAAEV